MKSFPAHISISQLADLTGRDRRTITRLLEGLEPVEETPTGPRYDIRVAVRVIFDFLPGEEDDEIEFHDQFQPNLEKAKLDFVKRKGLELDNEIKRRNLIPREELREILGSLFGSIRAKLLNMPTKAAQQIPEGATQKQVAEILRPLMKDALTELSEIKVDGNLK